MKNHRNYIHVPIWIALFLVLGLTSVRPTFALQDTNAKQINFWLSGGPAWTDKLISGYVITQLAISGDNQNGKWSTWPGGNQPYKCGKMVYNGLWDVGNCYTHKSVDGWWWKSNGTVFISVGYAYSKNSPKTKMVWYSGCQVKIPSWWGGSNTVTVLFDVTKNSCSLGVVP